MTLVPNLLYEDIFRMQSSEQRISFLVRIRRNVLSLWLQDETLPCSCTPLGEDVTSYRILWDKQIQTLAEGRKKYSAMSGFMGIVQTPKGLGARFRAGSFEAARESIGQPTGDNYLLKGIPVELPMQHIESLLMDMQWKATLLPESRRTRGRTAVIRARALQPPSSMIYRITSGPEAYTLAIEKQELHKKELKKPTSDPPSSWADAAKRAMGKSPVQEANGKCFKQRHIKRAASRDRACSSSPSSA